MLRLSRLTDYSIVIVAHLAKHAGQASNAKSIARQTGVALPTASKLLKHLTRHQLLIAQRGINGGYRLALPAAEISLVTIIQILEGQIALTECSHTKRRCAVEEQCMIRDNWRKISALFQHTLRHISVADLLQPLKLNALLHQPIALSEQKK